jgi:hypothetical protein
MFLLSLPSIRIIVCLSNIFTIGFDEYFCDVMLCLSTVNKLLPEITAQTHIYNKTYSDSVQTTTHWKREHVFQNAPSL